MKGKTVKAFLILILLLLLTGCWSRRELNELSIAVAMGLDADEDGQYVVSVQLVNPAQISYRKSGPEGTPVSTFQIRTHSLFAAVRKLTTKVNRQIYLSHLRLLVIGEELARRGIGEPLDFLSRDHEVRTDFSVVVSKDMRAEKVLAILTPQEKIPANHLYTSLDISEKVWAETGKVTLEDLLNDLASEGKSPSLTGLAVHGPPNEGTRVENLQTTAVKTLFQYNGLAVFKADKLLGWLNEDDSKGYQFTQGKVKSTVIVNDCRRGQMEVELIRASAKMKGKVEKGEPHIDLNIRAEGNLGDITCPLDLTDPSSILYIERLTEQAVAEKITRAVRTVQSRYKTDIFGFGEAIHRSSPRHWKRWKSDWDVRFQDLTVHTKVSVKIRRIGTIGQSIKSRVRK